MERLPRFVYSRGASDFSQVPIFPTRFYYYSVVTDLYLRVSLRATWESSVRALRVSFTSNFRRIRRYLSQNNQQLRIYMYSLITPFAIKATLHRFKENLGTQSIIIIYETCLYYTLNASANKTRSLTLKISQTVKCVRNYQRLIECFLYSLSTY